MFILFTNLTQIKRVNLRRKLQQVSCFFSKRPLTRLLIKSKKIEKCYANYTSKCKVSQANNAKLLGIKLPVR